jgi:ABC-2 type transport system permease protein
MTGSIYDLGYRRYDGPRLGRRHAVIALFRHSLRSVFGLGRGGRAKILPFICIGLPTLIAAILVGIRALAGRAGFENIQLVPGHEGIYPLVAVFPILFVASQAPELLGRDQRYRTLTLYFSRALHRPDYAVGKLLALSVGVGTILILPQLIMMIGTVLLTADTAKGIGDEARKLPAILGSSLVIAVVSAAIALAIASLTPRRAYATAAIFGVFIIPGIVAAVVIGLDLGSLSQWVILIDVGSLLDGANAWFFGVSPTSEAAFESGVPAGVMTVAAILIGAAATGFLVARYQRISA